METAEVVSITASLGLLILYHIKLYASIGVTKDPQNQLFKNIQNVSRWIEKHKENGDAQSVTLAIQTLRNTIMVAVFVGGNAFAYGYQSMGEYSTYDGNLRMQWRATIISACLVCSFLCWACVIRFASHMGYTIGTLSYEDQKLKQQSPSRSMQPIYIPNSERGLDGINEAAAPAAAVAGHCPEDPYLTNFREFEVDVHQKTKLIMVFFSLGFRFIFLALPFLFLSIGPLALAVSTIVMLTFLYFYDY